ncbi:MAG: S8 family serine peptidase [Thermoanaerobacterales bacterium]|nr:S8 family serine peptidase [Thermoanaerobacterales bacterium]
MILRRVVALALAFLLAMSFMVLPATAGVKGTRAGDAGGPGAAYVPGEVIVKFKDTPGAEVKAQVLGAHRALGLAEKKALPGGAALLRTGADVEAAVAALRTDPWVEYAQPNYIYHVAAVNYANEPLWNQQWGLNDADYGARAPEAWNRTAGSDGVIVAVIDTGANAGHPDLQGRLVAGYDFVNNDDDPADDNGHGTHVAGIIAAADNSVGILGAAPGVSIMPVKALDASGSAVPVGTTDSIVDAINYAGTRGVDVVNMSFGGQPSDEPGNPTKYFDPALYYAIKDYPNTLFVAAAGNETNDNDALPVYPASFSVTNMFNGTTYPALPNVVAVAALAPNGALADFSNYGDESVLLAAPGENIWSALPAFPDAGVAVAVYDEAKGYKSMFWGFGLEDLSTSDQVYDCLTRTVRDWFGLAPGADVLVVDDDHGMFGDTTGYYTGALADAGYNYQLIEVPQGAVGPSSVVMATYDAVIWQTGWAWWSDANGMVSNLTDADIQALTAYLDGGGNILLCGQDAGYLIEGSDFYTIYLKAEWLQEATDLLVLRPLTGLHAPYGQPVDYVFNEAITDLDLLSARPGGELVLGVSDYAAWSGTSMAAPFVSAGAALALSLKGSLSPSQLADILRNKSRALGSLDGKVASGGTLDLAAVTAYVAGLSAPPSGGGGGGGGGAPAPTATLPPGTEEFDTTGDAQSLSALDGQVNLDLPAGALPDGAKVTVKLAADEPEKAPAGAVAVSPVFSFETTAAPAKPVTVRLRYDAAKLAGLDPRALLVFRRNGDGTWTRAGGRLDRAAQAVSVELDHFSEYAVFGVRRSFPDIAGHWAANDIALLAARGVFDGVVSGAFSPDRPATRAELAAFLVNLKGLAPVTPLQPTFSDVPPTSRYYGAVEAAARAGLMAGLPDGSFKPDATVTREQMAAMLTRLAGPLGSGATGPVKAPAFADAAGIAPWAKNAVAEAAARGLMLGVAADRFAPKATITRAQAAAILARLGDRLGLFEVTTTVTGTLTWSAVEKPHWELAAGGKVYVLLPDAADKATAAFLQANQGREITVTGIPAAGPDIYMRGPVLRVTSVFSRGSGT